MLRFEINKWFFEQQLKSLYIVKLSYLKYLKKGFFMA